MEKNLDFYVYAYVRKNNHVPYYIGKGNAKKWHFDNYKKKDIQ